MNSKVIFDEENQVIFLKRVGPILPGDLTKAIKELSENPDFQTMNKLFIDISEADFSNTTGDEVFEHE